MRSSSPTVTLLQLLAVACVAGFDRGLPGRDILVPADVQDLQSAVAAAAPGDRVLLAPGRHETRSPVMVLTPGIEIQPDGTDPATATVVALAEDSLDSELRSVFYIRTASDEEVVLRDLTITGGRYGIVPSRLEGACEEPRVNIGGAGIFLDCGSSLRLERCRIVGNSTTSAGKGGGVLCNGGELTAVETLFEDNEANDSDSSQGGALACLGAARVRLEACSFVRNGARGGGGAIYVRGDGAEASVEVERCVFEDNDIALSGSTLTVNRSRFRGTSRALSLGGKSVLTNCLVVIDNDVTGISIGGSAALQSCTVVVPRTSVPAVRVEDAAVVTLGNCIIATGPLDPADPYAAAVNGPVRARHTCVNGPVALPGEGNLLLDPGFAAADDFRLAADSPCIDAGSPIDAPGVDLEGQQRPCGGGFDIGAYELVTPECLNPPVAFRRGDANADSRQDISDAVATLRHLFAGSSVPCLDATDTDDDGRTGLGDAVYLLQHLFRQGQAPPEPFGACGLDPTPDDVGCAGFNACN